MEIVGRMWGCFSMVVVDVDEEEALANSRWHRRVCMHVPTLRMEVNDLAGQCRGQAQRVRERLSGGWPTDHTRVKARNGTVSPDNSLIKYSKDCAQDGKIIMHSLYIFVYTKGTKDPVL